MRPPVRPPVRPSVQSSVCPSRTTLPHWSFRDLRYQPVILWDDAPYNKAGRYLRWLCSVNFCAFHGTLKFSITAPDQVGGWYYRSSSLMIWGISREFGRVMHSTINQIAIFKMTMSGPFLRVPRNCEIFLKRPGPGLRDDVTALTL